MTARLAKFNMSTKRTSWTIWEHSRPLQSGLKGCHSLGALIPCRTSGPWVRQNAFRSFSNDALKQNTSGLLKLVHCGWSWTSIFSIHYRDLITHLHDTDMCRQEHVRQMICHHVQSFPATKHGLGVPFSGQSSLMTRSAIMVLEIQPMLPCPCIVYKKFWCVNTSRCNIWCSWVLHWPLQLLQASLEAASLCTALWDSGSTYSLFFYLQTSPWW